MKLLPIVANYDELCFLYQTHGALFYTTNCIAPERVLYFKPSFKAVSNSRKCRGELLVYSLLYFSAYITQKCDSIGLIRYKHVPVLPNSNTILHTLIIPCVCVPAPRSINRQRLVAHSTAMESIQAESEPIDEEDDVP